MFKALPSDRFTLQHTLSNGKQANCLIYLPNPPGSVVIDTKFALKDFEALAAVQAKEEAQRRLKAFGQEVPAHIRGGIGKIYPERIGHRCGPNVYAIIREIYTRIACTPARDCSQRVCRLLSLNDIIDHTVRQR
ncbi:MAG: DNA recombination protein RmuC [Rhodobacteraceae bacterium]|nr:DNA recombination protein RmuC [Paracoccaceae bacterium]